MAKTIVSTDDLQQLCHNHSSGVGVIDKTSALLTALVTGPATLGTLSVRSGLTRATTHRIALALERVRLVARDADGHFTLGPRLWEMTDRVNRPVASHMTDRFGLLQVAEPVLAELRDFLGATARLYRRLGDARVCVAAAEAPSYGADHVPMGVALAMHTGPTAQVLSAWNRSEFPSQLRASVLAGVRRRGWAQSVTATAPAVASLAVPVYGYSDRVVAALTVTGPVDKLGMDPGRRHGRALIDAASGISAELFT